MAGIHWHDYLLAASLLAAVMGVGVLLKGQSASPVSEHQATTETLLRMTFIYWIVYCLAIGLQKFDLLEAPSWIICLKLTSVLSYFLTFSSLLCLPLHHFEARRQPQ